MAHSLLVPLLAIGAGVVAVKKGWVPNPVSWVKDKLSGHKETMPGQDWAHKNLMSGMYGVGQLAPAGFYWGEAIPGYQAEPYPVQAYYYGSPWAPPSGWSGR